MCFFSVPQERAPDATRLQRETDRRAVIGMITGAVLNMILDPILIYTLDMGVRGAAVATLISQLVTLSVYIWFFKSGKSYVRFGFSLFRPAKETYKEVIKIGLSMLFLQVLSSISMSLITRGARAYGDEAVAALGVVLRIGWCNLRTGHCRRLYCYSHFDYGHRNKPEVGRRDLPTDKRHKRRSLIPGR